MSNSQTKKELFLEILRFLVVGVVATLFDYAVFCLFDAVIFPLVPVSGKAWITASLLLSTAFGFLAGLFLNWILSVKFVFRKTKEVVRTRSRKAFWIFTVIALVGLALTELGVGLLVWALPEITLFGKTALFGTEWKKWLAKCVMTCVVLVWNYLARKTLVFRS